MSSVIQSKWCWAGLAVLAALLWQAAIVHTRFGGDWTGLYYSGDRFRLPPELEEHTYRHRDSSGYDAQFYRLMAHDPLARKGCAGCFDAESYRRRRVAVPAMAWLLGLGQTRLIDFAYLAVIHLLIGAGVVLLSCLSESYGRHPAWGLAFLFYPATMNGVARLLPDLALGVAVCGFLLWRQNRWVWAWVLLAAGCLTRELGVLTVAAAAGQELWRRRWGLAAMWASTALPALGWWASLWQRSAPGSDSAKYGWLGSHALIGFFDRIVSPVDYAQAPLVDLALQLSDTAAVAGLAAGSAAAVWCWWRNRQGDLEWLALAAASLALIAASPVFLRDEYSYPRAYSLLVGPLALMALKGRIWWLAAPLGLLSLRLALGMLGLLAAGLMR